MRRETILHRTIVILSEAPPPQGGGAQSKDLLRSPMRASLATLLPLALVACSAPPDRAVPTASVRDSAGVQIVTSADPEWGAGEGWQVDSVPLMVLGANEDDPQQQWPNIQTAVRLADGSVVVAVDGTLRRFGPDGRFDRVMSVRGEGPGEFESIGALQVMPGDTLRVHDPWLSRVAFYAPDGRYVREDPPALAQFEALAKWVECTPMLLSDGTRLGCQYDSAAVKALGGDPKGENEPGTHRKLIRRWAASPTLDTTYPLGMFSGLTSHAVALAPGRVVYVVHPFDPWPQIAGGGTPVRVALWASHDYRIEIWTPTGVLERIVQRVGARRTPREGEAARERPYMARTLGHLDVATRERVMDAVPRPDSMPAVVDLEFTSDGHLLVQREGMLGGQSTSIWDVFAPDGRFLGAFQIPGRVRIIQAGSDFFLVQRASEEYGALVEVYRVRR